MGYVNTETVVYQRIKTETDEAYLFIISDTQEVWLPKSQIEIDEEDKEIYLPTWLHDKYFI